jgi:broad-specificity NMP kinase
MSKSRKICLVLFIGIPGSGKTEFCKLLTRKLSISTARQFRFEVKHICYDDILEHVSHDREWRNARDGILKSVHFHAQLFIQVI